MVWGTRQSSPFSYSLLVNDYDITLTSFSLLRVATVLFSNNSRLLFTESMSFFILKFSSSWLREGRYSEVHHHTIVGSTSSSLDLSLRAESQGKPPVLNELLHSE